MSDNRSKYLKYKNKYIDLITRQSVGGSGEYKMITPATLMKYFGDKNVLIVNTLNNNPYFILGNNSEFMNLNSYGAEDFMEEIDESKLEKTKLLVFYCANYTCGSSRSFAKKFIQKYPTHQEKIVLYEGGLFEWASLALLYSDFSIVNDERYIKSGGKDKLDEEELEEIIVKYSHWLENKHVGFPDYVYENIGDENFYKNLQESEFHKDCDGDNKELLKDKVCVVTGATSGLGLETLKKMLDSGAKHVTGTFYNNIERAKNVEKDLHSKYGESKVKIIRADARTVEGNMLTFDAKKRNEYLPSDLVAINCADINAGIFGPANIFKKHIFNIDDEDYDKVMDLNLKGYYLGVKHFSKQAIENNVKDGSIVCIKSIYGSTGSLFSNPAYQISKHGTMGLVRQSAIEMARSNDRLGLKYPIRVNAVSPTFTDTALTKPMLDYNKINETIADSNTTGELARREDVANAVVFLCSSLSGSITGVDLPVDCGVLAESVPTYREVRSLNDDDNIEILSCCGDTTDEVITKKPVENKAIKSIFGSTEKEEEESKDGIIV